eukprot:EST44004.1 Hypothetical protein SS50377_16313 [Spironucleus salmonicida]
MFNLKLMNLNAISFYRGVEHKRKKISFQILHSTYVWQKNYRVFYQKDDKLVSFDQDIFRFYITKDIIFYANYFEQLAEYFLEIVNRISNFINIAVFQRPIFMHLLQQFQEARRKRRARMQHLKQNKAFLDCFYHWKECSINRRFVLFNIWFSYRNLIYKNKQNEEDLKYADNTVRHFLLRKYLKFWVAYKNTIVLRDSVDSELVKLSLPLKFLMNTFNDFMLGNSIIKDQQYFRQDQVVMIDNKLIYKEEATNLQVNQNLSMPENRIFQLKFKFLTRIRTLHSKTQCFYRLFLISFIYLNFTRYKLAFKLLQKRKTTYNDYLKVQNTQHSSSFSAEKQCYINKDVINFIFTISLSGKNTTLQEQLLKLQPLFIKKFVYIILSLSIKDLVLYYDDMMAQKYIKQEILFFFNVMLTGKFTYQFVQKKQVGDPDQTFINRVQKYRYLMSKFPQKTLTFLKDLECRHPCFSRFDFNSPLPKAFTVCNGHQNYNNFQNRFDSQKRVHANTFIQPFINNLVVPYSQFLVQSFIISDVQIQKVDMFSKNNSAKNKIGLIYQDADAFEYTDLTGSEHLVAERWFKLHNVTDSQTQDFIISKFKQYKKMYGDKAISHLESSIKTVIQYAQSQDSKLNSKFKKLQGIKIEKEDNYLDDIIYDTQDLARKNQDKLLAQQVKQKENQFNTELKVIKDRRRQKQDYGLAKQIKVQIKSVNIRTNQILVKDLQGLQKNIKILKQKQDIEKMQQEQLVLTSTNQVNNTETIQGQLVSVMSQKNMLKQNQSNKKCKQKHQLTSGNCNSSQSDSQYNEHNENSISQSDEGIYNGKAKSLKKYMQKALKNKIKRQKINRNKKSNSKKSSMKFIQEQQKCKQLRNSIVQPLDQDDIVEQDTEAKINKDRNTLYDMFMQETTTDSDSDYQYYEKQHNNSLNYEEQIGEQHINSSNQEQNINNNYQHTFETKQKFDSQNLYIDKKQHLNITQQQQQDKLTYEQNNRPKSQLVYSQEQMKTEITKQENIHMLKILKKARDLNEFAKQLLKDQDLTQFSPEIQSIINKFISNPLNFAEKWQSDKLTSLDKSFMYFLFSDINTTLITNEIKDISSQDQQQLMKLFSRKFRQSLYELLTLQIIGKEFSKEELNNKNIISPKIKLAFDDMVYQTQSKFPIIVKTNDFFDKYCKQIMNSDVIKLVEDNSYLKPKNAIKQIFKEVLIDKNWQPFIISYIEFRPTRQIPRRFITQQIKQIQKQEKFQFPEFGVDNSIQKLFSVNENIIQVQKQIPKLPCKILRKQSLKPILRKAKQQDVMGMIVTTYEKSASQRPSISIADWIIETNLDELQNFQVCTD